MPLDGIFSAADFSGIHLIPRGQPKVDTSLVFLPEDREMHVPFGVFSQVDE